MKMDPNQPFADGICFDDMHGMNLQQKNLLAKRGLVFLTEFNVEGVRYGGTIVSKDWDRAEEVAFGRGLGETVIGQLEDIIPDDAVGAADRNNFVFRTFAEVIEGLKAGKRYRRAAWPAGVRFVYLVRNSEFVPSRPPLSDFMQGNVRYACHLDMAYTDNHIKIWPIEAFDIVEADDWYQID